MRLRMPLCLALGLLLLAAPMPTTATAKNLKEVALPDGYKPEGVAAGWGDSVYVGSLLGRVIKVNVKTGSIQDVVSATDLVAPGRTPQVVGLKVSVRTRLMIIAGGLTGGTWVVKLGPDGLVDRAAPNSIQFVPLAANPGSLVNDVALREGCKGKKKHGKPGVVAYLTDTFAKSIYQLTCSSSGECSKTATFTDPIFAPPPTPPGKFPPLSLNGIVADPLPADTLLVGLTAQGQIVKVVITGATSIVATRVAITEGGHPADVLSTDGLLPNGKKGLFGVENRANKVTQLKFTSDDYTTAVVVQRVSDPAFANPSTIAKAAGSLYVVNSRFASCPQTSACLGVKFQLVRVDLK